MREMQTIVTDVCGVCLSVMQLVSVSHSLQPLPNYFGFLFITAIDCLKRLAFDTTYL